MTESEAKTITERDLNCLKQNKALPDSIEAMELSINALENQKKIKEVVANANQWSRDDVVVKAQAFCDIEKILGSNEK